MFGLFLRAMSRQRLAQKGVSGTTALAPYEQVVDCRGATYTITLPDIAEAAGRIYTFHCSEDVTAVTVTPNDAYQDTGQFTDVVLTALHDLLVIYCDGRFWYNLLEVST